MVEISVIIPVYNVEKYLKQCLESVVNQTFRDIEIICVNDGSTDNSLGCLESYEKQDERIRIITQKNKGLSGARNTGMKYATGKYIYFLDSDDYLELNALEDLHSLGEEKSLDLILFKVLNFKDETGEKYSQRYFDMPYLNDLKGRIFDYTDIRDEIISMNETVYSKFFKRELIEDCDFLEGYIYEDTLFLMDYIFDAKRMYFYDEYLYCRRIRDDSIIFTDSKNQVDVITIFNNVMAKLKQSNHYDYYKEDLFNRKMYSVYNIYKNLTDDTKDYFFCEFKKDCLSYKDEYESTLDFNEIQKRNKTIFYSVLNSAGFVEFDQSIEIFDLNDKISRLNRNNKKLKKQIKDLNKSVDELKDENRELKELNEEILNSKSWNVTKPFRKLRNLK